MADKVYYYKGQPIDKLSREKLLEVAKAGIDRILAELPTVQTTVKNGIPTYLVRNGSEK